jgi:hypothetical protein
LFKRMLWLANPRRNDMAHKELAMALGLMIAAYPAAAAQPNMAPPSVAPAGSPDTRYCLRVGPLTGNVAERVQCWTRAEWAEQEVDVDKEWAREGVRVIG